MVILAIREESEIPDIEAFLSVLRNQVIPILSGHKLSRWGLTSQFGGAYSNAIQDMSVPASATVEHERFDIALKLAYRLKHVLNRAYTYFISITNN